VQGIIDSLAAFLHHLADSGQWRGLPSQARATAQHVRDQAAGFLDAMADPANFGMAKGLFMGPALAGAMIDFEDPASLQAAMDRFNGLSFEERKALTEPYMGAGPPVSASFAVPPIRLPSGDSFRASAALSRLQHATTGLRSYLGDTGVALTTTGNLKLVDCKALVDLLDTGEAGQARSMDQLPQLSYIFDVALAAGATRKVKGRLLSVKRWSNDPTESATALAKMVLDLYFETGSQWLDAVEATLQEGVPYLLTPAMAFGETVTLEDMMPLALGAVEQLPLPSWAAPTALRRVVQDTLRKVLQRVALAGLVTYNGETDGVEMTPFGVQFMVDRMRALGFVVPELPSFAALSAEALLASVGDATTFVAASAWLAWQPDWSDDRRCRELVDALLSAPFELRNAHQRSAAFTLLDVAPTALVESELHRLLGGAYAGYALGSLAEHGLPSPSDQATTDDELHAIASLEAVMLPWVDHCFLDVTLDGPAAILQPCRNLFEDTTPEVLMATLLNMPIVEAAEMLDAIGSTYPHKPTAKLARTTRHRWQSRWQC